MIDIFAALMTILFFGSYFIGFKLIDFKRGEDIKLLAYAVGYPVTFMLILILIAS